MKKIFSGLISVCILFTIVNCSFAEGNLNNQAQPSAQNNLQKSQQTTNIFTLQQCVEEAIKNSLDIQALEIQKQTKDIDSDRADLYRQRLSAGSRAIDEGEAKLEQLQTLYAHLAGVPDNIPIPNINVISGGAFPAGTTKAQIKAVIDEASDKIAEGYDKVAASLVNDQVKELLGTKANMEIDVIKYGMQIAKTKIGLLIQNSFYEAAKNKEIVKIKEKTAQRTSEQERIAAEAYKSGMKAKDDMLLAQVLNASSQIELLNAKRLADLSMIELKKNMNIDLNKDIELKDDVKADILACNLEEGIKSGLKNRIEIKQANAELLITKLNFEITKRYEPDYTFNYREAELKVKEAELKYKTAKLTIEADIRKSYVNLMKTQEMMVYTKGLREKAEENLEIAKEKYQNGFDFQSANLKDLNLEEAAGTIIDVTAAEEKLSQVNEKIIELIYNYNQAKAKYLYDIGINL
ncbi:MAG: TolC family protein [Deltaproteobacteria bacterium]